jgi:predicted ATP-dependent serine protease
MNLNLEKLNINDNTNILDINVPPHLELRIDTGIDFVNRALGETDEFPNGGATPSTSIFLTGSSGCGKTTLALSIANAVTGLGHIAIFNGNEESLYQVRRTTKRLKMCHGFFCGEDKLIGNLIMKTMSIMDENPEKQTFIILDSVQTHDDGFYSDGTINSQTPKRVIEAMTSFAKKGHNGIYPIVILIGQVTKSGQAAGSNKLIHAVDTHCHMFIDKDKKSETLGERIFSVPKNRFGKALTAFVVGVDGTGIYEKSDFQYEF